jgi:hypothetical protein
MCCIGMLVGGSYTIIQTGYKYVDIFNTFGLVNILIYFSVGILFYGLVFYIFYLIDVKVRKILKKESANDNLVNKSEYDEKVERLNKMAEECDKLLAETKAYKDKTIELLNQCERR